MMKETLKKNGLRRDKKIKHILNESYLARSMKDLLGALSKKDSTTVLMINKWIPFRMNKK